MFQNTSLFGFQSTDPATRAAFDLCILDELQRDRKELELRKAHNLSELREEDE